MGEHSCEPGQVRKKAAAAIFVQVMLLIPRHPTPGLDPGFGWQAT